MTGADPLTDALAVASRYVALDPGLVADVKRAVAIAAGGAFDAVLGFEAWAQASSATNPRWPGRSGAGRDPCGPITAP